MVFIKSLDFTPRVNFSNKIKWVFKICKWAVVALAIFMVGMKTKSVLLKSDYQRKYENLVGVYTLEDMKKNNVAYTPANDSLYYKDLYIEKQSRWNILRKFDNKTAAFILTLNETNDSLKLYINKGGIGDSPDIYDYKTVLKGTFTLDSTLLTIRGVQVKDTLQLRYRRQNFRPKQWFW